MKTKFKDHNTKIQKKFQTVKNEPVKNRNSPQHQIFRAVYNTIKTENAT
jgi:hypothetical protein